MEYEADIESYLYWNKRTRFLLLMEQFVNRIITGEEFRDELWGSRRQLTFECNDFLKELYSETGKDFEVDPRSYEFGSFISLLICECENFTDDYENEEFYDSIKYWFLKLLYFGLITETYPFWGEF